MRSNNRWRWLLLALVLALGVVTVEKTTAASLWAAVTTGADATSVPSLWFSPLEIHFGSLPIGQRAQRVVDVRNLGDAPLTLTGGQVAAPFSLDYGSCAGELPGGASCQLTFTFAPTEGGEFTAEANGTTNAGPWQVALRGQTAVPEIQVNPRSLDFGRGTVGGEYPEQVVTITNIGGVAVGGFSAGPVELPFTGGLGPCARGLQPGESCRMTFDFAPDQAGVFFKRWTAQSDAGPIEIEMQGRTYSGISGTGQGVTPRAIDFGPVRVGDTVRQTVRFRNFDPSIPIVNWEYSWIVEDGDLDFDYNTDCGESLPGLTSCELNISYRPRHFGPDHVILNVLNSQGIIDIHLWGQGAAAEVIADSPAIDLGMAPDGRSGVQIVRFTNLGHGPANVLGVQSAPSFIIADSTCGEELAAGQSCVAEVRFEPRGFGRRDESIALLTGAGDVPVRVLGGLMTPELSVRFWPETIKLGELTRLRLTFGNSNPAQALFELGLDGHLPDGLVLLDGPPEFGDECGQPVYTAGANGTSFTLRDGALAAGQTCIVELVVRGVLSGPWRFEAAAISHAGPSATASDDMIVTVDEEEPLIRFFIPTIIKPGD